MGANVRLFDGTPFKPLVWRLLGVRIGKRVFDDGCAIVERTLVSVGDDCTLNEASLIQPHSQEDGGFKSDRIVIGAGCTIGLGALVHCGVTMGDGAELLPQGFLMKGEDVPAHSRWGENPAREILRRPRVRGGHGGRGASCAGDGKWPRRLAERRTRRMIPGADTSRDYWHGVLLSGGLTMIPRWTLDPVPGVAVHDTTLPDDLVASLDRIASDLAVPIGSVVLAAHAKVLASLSGELEVTTGYRRPRSSRCRAG